ncbi:MAG: preprotein translocase subunit SecE [Acidiferrobacteraceae bacterium]|nr:preprotein translocase subunit SecE [Acidiferrobacteraceae bacterium]
MACQKKVTRQVLDKVKLVAASLIVVGGVAVFYSFGGTSALLRTGVFIVSLIIGGGIALTSEPGKAAWQFALAARLEVRKVVWPTRRETVQSTMVVIALVILIGIYLWLLDVMSLWAVYDLILGVRD